MNNDPKQRFILMMALGLTFLLIMQWMYPPSRPAPTAPANQSAVRPAAVQSQAAARSEADSVAGIEAFRPETDYTIKVQVGEDGKEKNGYEATFSSVGAGLIRYRLLGHFRVPGTASPENRILLLNQMARNHQSLRIDSIREGPSLQDFRTHILRETRFQLLEIPEGAQVEPQPSVEVKRGRNLVFRAMAGELEVIRTYRFPDSDGGADFTMRFEVEIRNRSQANRLLNYAIIGPAGLVADDDSTNFGIIEILTARQPSAVSPSVDIERTRVPDLFKIENRYSLDNRANLAWVGAKNRFFTALMAAADTALADSNGSARILFPGEPELMPTEKDILENLKSQPRIETLQLSVPAFEEVGLTIAPALVEAGKSHQASYLLYAGPAVDTLMENADPRFQGVVSYTIRYLDFISRWLVQLLTFLDSILGNYGLAIIAVTIIIKIILHPLNRKSFVSMTRMSKLAPLMKEIQKKYAGDRVKMQQEMSKFYKEHGVSMAGGCLPVFLQLPIFFALYGAFSQGFSMRHAAFIPGWILDLSKPDSIYDLGWSIPILGSSHISLLPILYLGLQFLQMSLQPKASDPQQAQQQKIMKFMPLMFVFIFYSMPAGLVLYFTVSALTGVAESWWMRKMLLPKLGLGDDVPGAAEASGSNAKAGLGAAAVPSDAKKKKRKKPY